MPSGKQLTEREIGQIEALREEGRGFREIARRINRSDKVVRNYLKDPRRYGTTKNRAGRKKKLTQREMRKIGQEASNSRKSCESIKRNLELNVHRTTVWRAIQQISNIERQKMQKAPKLEPEHIQKRQDFASNNMGRNWNMVIIFNTIFKLENNALGDFFGREKVQSRRARWF